MFFRRLSEEEKLERKAKRKKEWRKFIKFMFLFLLLTIVIHTGRILFWKIGIARSVNYAWIVSKEVAPQARFEYAISTATYETPAKDKWTLSKNSELSHWLLSEAYERAKAKLPEDDPLLIILKFRRDTFGYKITQQNVIAYYQMCIDAIKAIQNSSIAHKDYHIGRSMIMIGAFINGKEQHELLRKIDINKYIELTKLTCKDRKLVPITQIKQGKISNNGAFAKYVVQIEGDVFNESGCLLLSTSMFADKASEEVCNNSLMDYLIIKHNKLMKWFRKSICNFPNYYIEGDARKSAKGTLQELMVLESNNFRKNIIKKCPSRAKELITVK